MAIFYARYNGGLFGGGGGGGSGSTPSQGAPTGAVDGVNVTYTLPSAPTADANLLLWLDGVIQYNGLALDYTLSGSTITMNAAPTAGQTLWYYYT